MACTGTVTDRSPMFMIPVVNVSTAIWSPVSGAGRGELIWLLTGIEATSVATVREKVIVPMARRAAYRASPKSWTNASRSASILESMSYW
jgi:hypothetical protein